MARKQYPEDIYLSPCFAIKRFMGLRQKHGDLNAVTKTEFKPEREMWISGVFLLGISQLTNKKYWLRPNNEDTAPDTFAITLLNSKKGVTAEIQNIEIFEYGKHVKVDIVTAIKQKLFNKNYPENYLLLCYIHDRGGEEFKPRDIFEAVKNINPKIAQIWVLIGVAESTSTDHVIVQVFPHLVTKKFDYIDLCKKLNQKEMIRGRRDLTKKTTEVEFEPLGKFILKLP